MESREISQNWMWHYSSFINNDFIKCDLCDAIFRTEKRTNHLTSHIFKKHEEFYYFILETKYGSNINWEQFYEMKNGQAICHICKRNFLRYRINMGLDLEIHLSYRHGITRSKTYALYDWLCLYFNMSLDERCMYYIEARCNFCDNVLEVSNSYTLMKHLCNEHEKNPPLILTPHN